MTQEGGGRGTGGLRRLFLLLDLERRDELRPGNFSCLEDEVIERDPVRGYRGPAEPREVERFRRTLLARLDRSAPVLDRPLVTGWMPLLVSAAVFGVLHDAWVAGGLAGLAFGLMRRHGGIWPVIGAHATANALLAVYVGVTGFWSVW